MAEELISEQSPDDVYAPLTALVEHGGYVILMGVGFESLTFIHLAEKMAGRNLFRRWAKDTNGNIIQAEVGGCSAGFSKTSDAVSPILEEVTVGDSLWKVFEAKKLLQITTQAIRQPPNLTHCDDPSCERCNDASRRAASLISA